MMQAPWRNTSSNRHRKRTKGTVIACENVLNATANVSVQSVRINGLASQLRYQCDFGDGLNGSKPSHTMIGTNVYCRLTQKGPCSMTMIKDIDDDSATKQGDFHSSVLV